MCERELVLEKGTVKAFAVIDQDSQNPWVDYTPFEYKLNSRNFYMASENMPELDDTDYWFAPIYAYCHGGMTVSTTPFSCKWDSGILGYVAVKRPSRGGEYKRRTEFYKELTAYVEVLDAYIKGDCYGLVFEEDGEVIDSVWGFIGDHETSVLLEQATSHFS